MKEFYKDRMSKIEERRSKTPLVDISVQGTSYTAAVKNVKAYAELAYEQIGLRLAVQNAMAELSDEALGSVYDKLKTDKTHPMFVKENLINAVRTGEGTTQYANLFHQEPDTVLDAFEEALGPERVARLEAQPPTVAPTNPAYKGPQSAAPHAEDIRRLEENALKKEKDPAKQEEIRGLLKRKAVCLEQVAPEVRSFYNKLSMDSASTGKETNVNLQTVLNHMPGMKTQDGLQQLAGGKFSEGTRHLRRQ